MSEHRNIIRIDEDIKASEYEALYSRYLLKRPLKDWLLKIDGSKGKKILDIGGGNGRLSAYLRDNGAEEVVLLDKNAGMLSGFSKDIDGYVYSEASLHNGVLIDFFNIKDANPSHRTHYQEHFDVAIANQSVNFWIDEQSAKNVASYIRKGGFFVFNTFNVRPPEAPIPIEYNDDEGNSYTEISYIPNPSSDKDYEKVVHIQIRSGHLPHVSSFFWVSPRKFREFLEPHFTTVTELTEGRTSFYFCLK